MPFPAWLVDPRDGSVPFQNQAAGQFRSASPEDGNRGDIEPVRSPVDIDGRHLDVVVAFWGAARTGSREEARRTPCVNLPSPGGRLLRQAVERAGMGSAELDCVTGSFAWTAPFAAASGHAAVREGDGFASWFALIHPEDRARVVARYEALFASSDMTATQVYRLRRSDGRDAQIEERIELDREDDGRVLRMVVLMSEVAQRGGPDTGAPMPGDHVARLLTEICHDLRQPLNGMELTMDALSLMYRDAGSGRGPNAAEAMPLLDGAKASVRMMAALCDHLVDLHMLDHGGFVPRPEPIRLDPVLKQVRTAHAPLASHKGLRIRSVTTSAMAVVDSILLVRVLSNLVGNAVENTRSGGVTIRCHRRREGVRIDVCDTGPGLPEDVPDPDDPLESAARAAARIHLGHGLGLAVVRRCAVRMGATLEVAAARDRGTRVSLWLPGAPDEDHRPGMASPREDARNRDV